MTKLQHSHLEQIREDLSRALTLKYNRGQLEHGGNLWERQGIISDLGDELIDAFAYYHCIKDRVAKVHSHVVDARTLLDKGDYVRLGETLDQIFNLTHTA
jgi:hypothetical protein